MEPIGTFQGLATGINFRDLVDQIIQAESRPVRLLEQRLSELDRKTTAWGDFESRVQTLSDRSADLSDGTLFDTFNTSVTGMASGEDAPLSASAGTSATPGTYSVKVLQTATHEKVASDTHADTSSALGLSGEFLVGGKAVSVTATDTLSDVAAAINQANTGTTPSGVSASVASAAGGGYRLILTADDTGAEGIALADGSAGVLRSLGFLDGTTSIKNATSDGAKSDSLLTGTTAVGTLLGLSSPPAAGAVTIGGFSVTIDLSADSLEDIASAINTAASGAGSAVTAQVASETDADGNTRKYLDISSTTSFTDTNGILETLGILESGRSAVQQVVQGAAFTDGDAVTVASGSTLLTDLWQGGASEAVSVGDTLTIAGTRGDGTTFTKTFTVGASSTYQDLVDALNSASDAFGSGSRTATASIDGSGRLVVTDDTGGDSRLALSIVANNEGGGTLDFGDFSTATTGRSREITAGVDAQLELDGVFLTSASNTVTDAVEGLTLTLTEASNTTVTVGVTRDVDAVVDGIESFIKAYNAAVEFVDSQFTGSGAQEGELKRPLSGDSVIRTMRGQLRAALEETISSVVTDVSGLSELGITLSREGTYDIDRGVLKAAVETDPGSVKRFFSVYGSGSTSTLEYVSSADATASGTYDIVVTTAPDVASATGVGFAGTYVDDATADTLTITDAGTGSVYQVSLTNGMTMTQIVDALNNEFQTATTRTLSGPDTLKADAVGTDAGTSTLLQDLHDDLGTNLGITDGDTFTISGTKDDGSSFLEEWVVTDVTTQTLGDLRTAIADAVGTDVNVAVVNGVLTATARAEGRKNFTLSVSSDNAGGGTFAMGAFDVTEAGRGKADITASDSGGQLALVHAEYGSAFGFDVSYTAGGADGTASLGLAAGSYRGVDIVGTIGGQSATGGGRILTGDADTGAEGLMVRYTGSGTGAVGSMTFSRGIASLMEVAAEVLLGTDGGSIQAVVDGIDTQEEGLNTRIDAMEERLDRRAAQLIERFTALEEAMAQAQQQMAWLQAQLGSMAASGLQGG